MRVLGVVVGLGILASTIEAAERRAVRTMTEILLTFNHSASPAAREALEEIVNDEAATACERVVATTLLKVRHIASVEDAVIVNLTHTINVADRRMLKALLE